MADDRFNTIAKEYDLWPIVDPAYHLLHESVIKRIEEGLAGDPRSTISVFEIGYGTGHTTKMILEADPRIRIIGADPSSGMLAEANNLLDGTELAERAQLCLGGALDVMPHYGPYAQVVSVCTLHNMVPSERPELCRLSFENLEPGGLYISGDKVAVNDPAQYLLMWDRWVRDFDGFLDHGLLDSYYYWRNHEVDDHLNRYTEAEAIGMLEAAGFVDVTIVERLNMYVVITARKPR